MQSNTLKNDFTWSSEQEPHISRRRSMLKKYPQIRQLNGSNPWVAFSSLALVIVQVLAAYYVRFLPWWGVLLLSYVLGATIIQAVFLAIHEFSHNLVFKKRKWNEAWSMLINIPVVFPYAISFKRYHLLHHSQQGVDGIDTDIPSRLECKTFRGTLGKALWYCNQIFFYAIRPMMIKPMKINKAQAINFVFQVLMMALILPQIGLLGTGYLLLSIFLQVDFIHALPILFLNITSASRDKKRIRTTAF